MVEKKKKTTSEGTGTAREATPRKRRRHGYRGYPLSKEPGGVHFGRGFSGAEPLGGTGSSLPKAGIFTEQSTKRTPES